jgi:hypothetical protein
LEQLQRLILIILSSQVVVAVARTLRQAVAGQVALEPHPLYL